MDLCIDKNLIDKDEYPQTAELERRCVRMLAGLWNAASSSEPVGCSAIGSSEGCMLGGMAAKWRWRAKREAAGKPTDKPNMVCGPVQVVWHKFARYWDVEIREIPMSPGKYQMDVEQMLERVDENTIMVVPTFGVTYTGTYEPVLELSQALDTLQEEKGLDVDIHVDGASGAFLAPFCAPDILWDFRVPRVKSISSSGTNSVSLPSAWAGCCGATRPSSPDDLIFHVTYLGATCRCSSSTSPARPADRGAVLQLRAPGPEGYRNVHDACYNTGKFLAEEVVKLGRSSCSAARIRRREFPRWPGASRRARSRLHALRPRRPPAGSRLAGAGLSADRFGVGHLGAADPRAPGREPRPCQPAPQRHGAVDHPLHPPPGERADDQRGVRRLQPPVTAPPPGTAAGTPRDQSTRSGAAPEEAELAHSPGDRWSRVPGRPA